MPRLNICIKSLSDLREFLTMRNRKQAKKKDHTGLLALIVLVVVFAGIAFLINSPSAPHTGVQSNQAEDAFFGAINNVRFQGKITGIVKADTNCKPVQSGLTNCIAIIIAADGKELHFNYTHDMSKQECLATGNTVTIIPESDGTVKVTRG